jgi:transcription antitermination factor NusA-like protein
VKTELCSFCLKSGILCQKCSAKVKAGEISEVDLKIARLLLSLEEKYSALQNICFYKAVEVDRTLAIIVGHGDMPRLLGYGGKILKALGEETGKSIRILEYGVDDRKFLEDLFMPLSILTINTIWLPDGTTETRAILKKRRGAPVPFDVKALKEIASKVRQMSLRVEFAG